MIPALLSATSTELVDRFEPQAASHNVKYSDMIRFFEVYPDVTYIFESTMTEELHQAFLKRLNAVIEAKRLPMEDLCRVLNILVRLSAYGRFDE